MAVNPPTNVNIAGGSSGNTYYVLNTAASTPKLSWRGASGSGITGYLVKMRTYNGSSWTDYEDYTTTRPTVSTTATSGSMNVKQPSTAGHQYQFVVYTMAGSTTSAASASSNARPKIVAYSAGKAPTTVTISATTTTTASASLTLSWSGAAGGTQNALSSYTVQYSDDGTTWTNVATGISTSTTSMAVTGPASGGTRRWRVQAVCAHATYTSSTVSCMHYTNGTASIGSSSSTTTAGQGFSLTWTATAGTNNAISSQKIQRSTNNSTWRDAYSGLGTTARSHTVSGPTTSATIYYYRVVVTFARNTVTTGSMSRTYYTNGACSISLSPNGWTTNTGNATLTVSRTAGTNNAASNYKVQRSTDNSTWSDLATNQSGGTYAITISDTLYYYRVVAPFARNTVTTGSVWVRHYTNGTIGSPSASPTQTTTSGANVTLSWTKMTAGTNNAISNLKVQRSTDASTWSDLSVSGLTTTSTSCTVAGPTTSTTKYYWRLVATFAHNTVTTSQCYTTYYTNGTCTISLSPNGWTKSTGNATLTVTRTDGVNNTKSNYKVERSTNNSTWTELATNLSAGTYTVTISDTLYYYRVTAPFVRNTVTTGSVWVGHYTDGTAPGAVTAAPSKVTVGNTTVLTWAAGTAGTNNALSKYTIEYSDNNGAWTSYSTNATSPASVDAPAAGVTRRYRVTAVYARGDSHSSTVYASVTGYAAPTAPTSVTIPANCYGSTAITVSFSGATNADHYESQYATTTDGTYGSWSSSTTRTGNFTATFGTLPIGQKAKFRIRTVNGANTVSSWKESNETTKANTAPTTPGTPDVSPLLLASGNISLNWTASTDVDGSTGGAIAGYSIETATRANPNASWGNWSELTTVSTNSYTHTWSASELNQIKYRVRAYDEIGAYSSYSDESSVVTKAVSDPLVLPVNEGASRDNRPYVKVTIYTLAAQNLQMRSGNTSGSWNAWTTCASLSAGLNTWTGKCPADIAIGSDARIQLRVGSEEPFVTFALRYEAPAYGREIATGSEIHTSQYSHVTELNQMLSYVNDMRGLYGLQAIAFADSVGYFATWNKNVCQLQNGINEMYAYIHGDSFTPRDSADIDQWPTASEVNLVRRRIMGDET